jgi:hypothetical protein
MAGEAPDPRVELFEAFAVTPGLSLIAPPELKRPLTGCLAETDLSSIRQDEEDAERRSSQLYLLADEYAALLAEYAEIRSLDLLIIADQAKA